MTDDDIIKAIIVLTSEVPIGQEGWVTAETLSYDLYGQRNPGLGSRLARLAREGRIRRTFLGRRFAYRVQ